MSKPFVYSGCDNLEVMADAKNYNKFLISIITKEIAKFGAKPKVLDFGAGSGTYADMVKDKGIALDCLEPDKILAKILHKKGYTVFDYADKLKPNSYDVIYAFNVLEHIEDDFAVFTQLSKALKKNGVIVIYVPAFKSIWSPMDNLVGHYRRYRKDRLHKMAKDNKLKIVKLRYVDPLGYGAALAYKATKPKAGTISPLSLKIYDRAIFPFSRLIEPATRPIVGKNVVLVAKKGE